MVHIQQSDLLIKCDAVLTKVEWSNSPFPNTNTINFSVIPFKLLPLRFFSSINASGLSIHIGYLSENLFLPGI